MLRRFLTSYPVWATLLAFADASRGSAYLLTPAAASDSLAVVRGLADMHAWGWAFCVLAVGCLAGVRARLVGFVANGVLGVFLNTLLAAGLGWQAITCGTPWTTVGGLALVAVLHATIAVHLYRAKAVPR